MSVKCIAVDDEPMALKLVESYIAKTPFLQLEGTFQNPMKALNFCREFDIDLIYLDINMPDLSGIDLSKLLPENVKVIFTTAYDEFAVQSYRLNALDYLLKPFSYREFLEASQKAQDVVKHEVAAGEDNIFVKSEYKLHQVRFCDILFIENLKDYVRFWLKDGQKLMSLLSMKSLVETLPENFMRVHRSFIINKNEIEMVERNRIIIRDQYIPVAEAYQERFKSFLKEKTA